MLPYIDEIEDDGVALTIEQINEHIHNVNSDITKRNLRMIEYGSILRTTREKLKLQQAKIQENTIKLQQQQERLSVEVGKHIRSRQKGN